MQGTMHLTPANNFYLIFKVFIFVSESSRLMQMPYNLFHHDLNAVYIVL